MSQTIQAVLDSVKTSLKEKGIESYSLDARLILSKALDLPQIKLVTHNNDEINERELHIIEEYTKRRLRREPMQYILGHCEFMGLDFELNKNTLIPRADTENAVEIAISIIKEKGYKKVLDIGTGSGAIAVSIGKYTDADITASDISRAALDMAERNARKNNVNVKFIKSDIFENIDDRYDMIISNPPYIERGAIADLDAQVKDHEPLLALDGGEDGLDLYRKIIDGSPHFLKKGGCIIFEIGYNQGYALYNLLKESNFENISLSKDLAGLDRVIRGYAL